MKIVKNITCLIALFCGIQAFSQQLPQFTQYMYNTISINPAYAGSRGSFSVVGLHRSQWAGFEGGPSTQTVSVNSMMKNEKVGLGFSFINDKLGYENFTYLYGDFAYNLQVGADTKLALGLKAGFTHYSLDEELITDPAIISDPYFQDFSNRWSPNIGVGSYLYSERWYLGLSAPRILTNDYNDGEAAGVDYVAFERVSYYLTGGYVFDMGKDVKFKPAMLLKATNGAPLSFDATANFLFNEKLWLGAAYRFDSFNTFGALIDFQVSDRLRLGYTYELPVSGIRPYTNGTHEFLLIYEINKKRIKSPRYF
ncbi:type IX secretion system membrane protein PorP/SprF [Zhouia spongiae]|uniref:Type IX secretion system membrane protein PorP/SprF n=1 Tax=Zhouia spongiae TaxID=2202721 RepID=A0ABY3YMY0_9FLAO|nr:type IX secretion system membrane protein PorP/SprF [Zhouia spongiae]UNY98523.1 type IX secretion system membrane protein PorP/SprF [Zhouia spongiae]